MDRLTGLRLLAFGRGFAAGELGLPRWWRSPPDWFGGRATAWREGWYLGTLS